VVRGGTPSYVLPYGIALVVLIEHQAREQLRAKAVVEV
jgi:hypothetical protein